VFTWNDDTFDLHGEWGHNRVKGDPPAILPDGTTDSAKGS